MRGRNEILENLNHFKVHQIDDLDDDDGNKISKKKLINFNEHSTHTTSMLTNFFFCPYHSAIQFFFFFFFSIIWWCWIELIWWANILFFEKKTKNTKNWNFFFFFSAFRLSIVCHTTAIVFILIYSREFSDGSIRILSIFFSVCVCVCVPLHHHWNNYSKFIHHHHLESQGYLFDDWKFSHFPKKKSLLFARTHTHSYKMLINLLWW